MSWEDSIRQHRHFPGAAQGFSFCLGQRAKDCGGEDSTSFTGIVFIYLSCFYPASRRRKGAWTARLASEAQSASAGIMINAAASDNAMKKIKILGIKCFFYFLLVVCIWAGVFSVFAFAFAFLLHLANGLGKGLFFSSVL